MEHPHWTAGEAERRNAVLARIREYVAVGRMIPLDRKGGEFSGEAGPYRYIFEGEDDLLHLAVQRLDGKPLELGETGPLARFLLPSVPEAQIWMRPGEQSHHYYLGHDLLLEPD